MLKNFIQTSDLKKYYPTIDTNLWRNVSDYSQQIAQGFEKVKSDLWSKGIDPRKVMLPINLCADLFTETAQVYGDSVEAYSDFNRFAITAIAGVPATIQVYGSNNNSDFTFITSIETSAITNFTFDETYKYYKVSMISADGGTTISADLYETVFDRAIIQATFTFIFADFMKEVGDIWDIKRQLAEQEYNNTLTALKYYYDSNDNQTIESEEVKSFVNVTLVR